MYKNITFHYIVDNITNFEKINKRTKLQFASLMCSLFDLPTVHLNTRPTNNIISHGSKLYRIKRSL